MKTKRIAITWQLSDSHGWGVFGLNLALQLIKMGGPTPLLLAPPLFIQNDTGRDAILKPFVDEQIITAQKIETASGPVMGADVVVLHALGNAFMSSPISSRFIGRKNIGVSFFEETGFDANAITRAKKFDRIIAGSSWNLQMMQAAKIDNGVFVSQGIDDAIFHSAPEINKSAHKNTRFKDRYTIFSGGKLELRKAQDLAIEAFKVFHRNHDDALLVTAWQNNWPTTAESIKGSPHIQRAPKIDSNGDLRIADWAAGMGLGGHQFIDLGWVANQEMPSIFNDMDLALFPNRCEGGTNLVAMEAMASGIPCIIAANTGQIDLIADNNCYPLQTQTQIAPTGSPAEHWRNSDINEIIAVMEHAYSNRDDARRIGEKGAAFMKKRSWEIQVQKLIDALSDLL